MTGKRQNLHCFTRFVLCLITTCLIGLGQAQIVVPTFGTRGDVAANVLPRFMELFRQQLALRSGEQVLLGKTVAQTSVAQLEPDVAAAIATLGHGRYSVAGEIVALNTGLEAISYSVNILVTDARTKRSSDLFSQPLDPTDMPAAVASLSRAVVGFVDPADMPARGSASLFVTSEPKSAEIFLNGVRVGNTQNPLIPIAPGRYNVELRKKGYVPENDVVELGDEETQFLAFSLREIKGGSIMVSSLPSADVYLDGKLVGQSPMTIEALPGQRTLRLARPGFESAAQAVTVRNFFVTRVPEIRLTPAYASLVFWTPPKGFVVSVDGAPRALNFAPNLTPGLHSATLSRSGVDIPFSFELPGTGVYELDIQTHKLRALQ